MTTATIQQRTWVQPRNRKTWDEVYTEVRASMAAYSTATLSDAMLHDAVRRAVENAWPHVYQEEIWQVNLPAAVDSITLPWQPTDVVSCGWLSTNPQTAGRVNAGFEIPDVLWEVEGNQWRWLQLSDEWPTGPLTWVMDAIGKPRTALDEPVYCTVPTQHILQLAEAECMFLMALDGGLPMPQAAQTRSIMRNQALAALPTMRRPPRKPKFKLKSFSTVIFWSWSQVDLTFADLA